jgi:hypothetical protein
MIAAALLLDVDWKGKTYDNNPSLMLRVKLAKVASYAVLVNGATGERTKVYER